MGHGCLMIMMWLMMMTITVSCVTARMNPIGEPLASGVCGDDCRWVLEDGVLTITGTGKMNSSTWKEYSSNIHVVDIKDGITSIIWDAFQSFPLTSVSIPYSVKSINSGAFSNCPSSIFKKYNTSLYLGNSENPYYALIKAESNTIESCELHENTGIIAASAFSGCSSMKEIKFSNSLTTIGSSAFRSCPFTSIAFPESLITIEEFAFIGCSSLTSVKFSGPIKSIDDDAFKSCSELSSFSVPDSLTYMGRYVFSYCDKMQYNEYGTALYLGNENNPYHVLMQASNKDIKSCEIHKNTRVIGGAAFESSRLQSVTIPDGVVTVGANAFQECDLLSSITIPKTVTYIGIDAFSYSFALKQLCYLGTKKPECPDEVFENSRGIDKVDVTDGFQDDSFCEKEVRKEGKCTQPEPDPSGSNPSASAVAGKGHGMIPNVVITSMVIGVIMQRF